MVRIFCSNISRYELYQLAAKLCVTVEDPFILIIIIIFQYVGFVLFNSLVQSSSSDLSCVLQGCCAWACVECSALSAMLEKCFQKAGRPCVLEMRSPC